MQVSVEETHGVDPSVLRVKNRLDEEQTLELILFGA